MGRQTRRKKNPYCEPAREVAARPLASGRARRFAVRTDTPQPSVPKKLYVAVPVEGLADVLVDGIASGTLSASRKGAVRRQGAKRKRLALVVVRARRASREGLEFRASDSGWEPAARIEPHLLECDDDRALRRVKARRKRSAGGLLVSSLEDPRVLLMYRVHGENDAWKTPKGGIARGESMRRAARREVAEESGLHRVKILGSLGDMQYFKREDGRLREKTVRIYLMLHEDGETEIKPRAGERYVRGEWLPFAEAIDRVTQKQARAIIARAERFLAGPSAKKAARPKGDTGEAPPAESRRGAAMTA
jgi:8-oxo-dGTP pyrophosphatase MutT (NUDIX family)